MLLDALITVPLPLRPDAVALFAKAAIETNYLADREVRLIDGTGTSHG